MESWPVPWLLYVRRGGVANFPWPRMAAMGASSVSLALYGRRWGVAGPLCAAYGRYGGMAGSLLPRLPQ